MKELIKAIWESITKAIVSALSSANNPKIDEKSPEVTTEPKKASEIIVKPSNGRFTKWNDSWTAPLDKLITAHLETFLTAKDLNRIRVGLLTLPKDQQVVIFREFVKAICYYESGFNPKSQSVDVGTKADKDTWSVGLMQMSVVDQKNYKTPFLYDFAKLNEAIPNLELALFIMARQVKNTGLFILHKSHKNRYWAVILDEGKYSKLPEILSYTRNYSLEVPEVAASVDNIRNDIVSLLKKDIGQRETNGKNRSPLIDAICKHFGLGLGNPYCIGWVLYRSDQYCKAMGFKNPLPKTMSTQEFYRQTPPAYKKPKGLKAKKSDVGIQQQYADAARGHAYVLTDDETTIQATIEANTNPQGSRDGDGVYYNSRTQDGDQSKKYLGAVDIAKWIFDANFKA